MSITIEDSIYTNVVAIYEELKGNATLRDKFAMAALAGDLAGDPDISIWRNSMPDEEVKACKGYYRIADAMLEARKK